MINENRLGNAFWNKCVWRESVKRTGISDSSISNVKGRLFHYSLGATTENDRLSSVVKDFYVGKFRIMLLFDLKQ